MAAVTVFRSTTGGAPALSNTAGALIAVLDYILVTGMSWSKTVLATNQASYTQPGGSNGFVLQVDDTGTTIARVTAWETLSAFNTGTNLSPSVSFQTTIGGGMSPNGIWVQKGAASPWRAITNGSFFMLFINWSGSNSTAQYSGIIFGDTLSYKAGDAYNTILVGQSTSSNGLIPGAYMASSIGVAYPYSSALNMISVMRNYTQLGSSIPASLVSDYARAGGALLSGVCSSQTNPFPSLIDGSFVISPIWQAEPIAGGVWTSFGIRALVPGLWFINHTGCPLVDGQIFTASSGNISGRTFEAVGGQGATSYGQVCVETSNTWGGF